MATVEVPRGEFYQLQKLKIQEELKGELSEWAKSRFWLFALIFAVIGFFGVRALVRELINEELKTARQASADAQAAGALARESAKEARAELVKNSESMEVVATTATQLSRDLDELRSRIDSEGERSIAAAEMKISGLGFQIQELQRVLTSLSADSERHRAAASEAETRLQQLRSSARDEQADFENNGRFRVTLVPFGSGITADQADAVSSVLTGQGFRPSLAPWGYSDTASTRRKVKISYPRKLKDRAHLARDLISPILSASQPPYEVVLEESALPISNQPPHIAIFWE
ncbi:hypothetical protein ASF73_19945 [Xanthomonas sp. Leaf131]|nr:hypothetical protein ASF73_19945 [Xanthomonas sp. Leaf131]